MTVGARCPYCQSRNGDDPVRCPACGAIGHRDCWYEYGGCAVPGCRQAPKAAVATSPPVATSPSVVSSPPAVPSAPAVPPGWFPDPQGSGRQRWWSGTAWTDHLHPPPGS